MRSPLALQNVNVAALLAGISFSALMALTREVGMTITIASRQIAGRMAKSPPPHGINTTNGKAGYAVSSSRADSGSVGCGWSLSLSGPILVAGFHRVRIVEHTLHLVFGSWRQAS